MKLHDKGVYLVNGQLCDTAPVSQEEARKGTHCLRHSQGTQHGAGYGKPPSQV